MSHKTTLDFLGKLWTKLQNHAEFRGIGGVDVSTAASQQHGSWFESRLEPDKCYKHSSIVSIKAQIKVGFHTFAAFE